MPRPGQRLYRSVLLAVAVICFANVVAFFVVGDILGGAAGNGKIEGGRHFIGDHGRYTAVSEAVYTYSLWHGRSIFLTNVLGGLAGMAWFRMKRSQPARTPPAGTAPGP